MMSDSENVGFRNGSSGGELRKLPAWPGWYAADPPAREVVARWKRQREIEQAARYWQGLERYRGAA